MCNGFHAGFSPSSLLFSTFVFVVREAAAGAWPAVSSPSLSGHNNNSNWAHLNGKHHECIWKVVVFVVFAFCISSHSFLFMWPLCVVVALVVASHNCANNKAKK